MTVRPAKTQSDQSSLCAQWVVKELSFLYAYSEDWVHLPFCWFCHEAAHIVFDSLLLMSLIPGFEPTNYSYETLNPDSVIFAKSSFKCRSINQSYCFYYQETTLHLRR